MSVSRPEIVGRLARSSRVTAVAAPERVVLKTASFVATTVTVSETPGGFSENSRSRVTPNDNVMSFRTSGEKDESDAVTV